MLILDLEQKSPEWLQYRLAKLTGTDMGCVLGVNPFKSIRDVYDEKMGIAKPVVINAAMQRGMDYEDEALGLFNKRYGLELKSMVIQSEAYPWAMASLDGADSDSFVEIKTPKRSNFERLSKGIPAYYYVQMQMAFLCSDGRFDTGVFLVYRPEDKTLVEIPVYPDEGIIKEMIVKGEAFMQDLMTFNRPVG